MRRCEPFISIIIPMYNVAPYIARCIESCLAQTLSEIEILIIDDRGSDESARIATEYATRDSRIQILQNPRNLGTFHTRLEGIRYAKGLYTLMLDGDDFLRADACEILYSYMAQNPDIIHFKASYLGDTHASLLENLKHKSRYILPTQWSKKPLRDSQIAHNFFLKSKHFPKFTLWDKCYKTNVLKKVFSSLKDFAAPICIVDDMVLFFLISCMAETYVSTHKQLYYYCLNHTSISQNPQSKKRRIQEMSHAIEAFNLFSSITYAPYAPQIAQTMIAHLQSLIILESRFDTSCVDGTKGGAMQTSQNLHLPMYLDSCLRSLKYWNRSLTYIRIFVYILSFGRIKL